MTQPDANGNNKHNLHSELPILGDYQALLDHFDIPEVRYLISVPLTPARADWHALGSVHTSQSVEQPLRRFGPDHPAHGLDWPIARPVHTSQSVEQPLRRFGPDHPARASTGPSRALFTLLKVWNNHFGDFGPPHRGPRPRLAPRCALFTLDDEGLGSGLDLTPPAANGGSLKFSASLPE